MQCFAGNCARGMSLVALHNGGGVGIGKAVNGGFGMVCDGSERVDEILRSAMLWDVMGVWHAVRGHEMHMPWKPAKKLTAPMRKAITSRCLTWRMKN